MTDPSFHVAQEELFAPAPQRPVAAAGIREAVLIAVLVFSGYYAGARVGLALTFCPSPISVLWPPNAILVAAMMLVPSRLWWLVAAAALPAHLISELHAGIPVMMVLCWYVSNVAEAVIGHPSCAPWAAPRIPSPRRAASCASSSPHAWRC
jgi:MASE1